MTDSPPPEGADGGESSPPVQRRKADQFSPGAVLIVDDEPANIALATRWMVKAGYSVLTAATGIEALNVMQRDQVDLVLMDVMMPDMDGYAVYNEMRRDPVLAEIPVVFVTAHAAPEERVRGLRMGAADYLSKPYYGDELLARIASALRTKGQREVLQQRARQLEEQTIKDPLTGLYNRRFLDERLAQEVIRAERYGLVVSCIIFDIDHFKQVNDTLGHDVGDRTIKNVAAAIGTLARSTDFAARFGGDEFVIILPQTGAREAYEVAERIRGRISEIVISSDNSEHHLTVSAGVASLPGGKAVDAATLLRDADQALLQAKALGKNRTTLATALAHVKDGPTLVNKCKRILIVEDEPNNQALLQKVLTKMGYEWFCVSNGEDGVARATSEDYALVLMDLSLPGMDGWEATRMIRSAGKTVPVIATSAHAMAADKERAAAAGCNDYITKPYNLSELRRTLEQYVPLTGR